MSIYERFEYPQPVLSIDADMIDIETSSRYEGGFAMKNVGGGVLSGRITSNTRCLKFTPEEFEGNHVKIHYSFNPGIYKTGDTLRTDALIISNGGERLIPVRIKITPPAIITEDGVSITSLDVFVDYAKKEPQKAQVLLISPAFKRFLSDIDYPLIMAYEQLITDTVGARALEQFLILSGLKEKTDVVVMQDRFELFAKPGDTGLIYGAIPISRNEWGYLDVPVQVENLSPWLSVASHVTHTDFNNTDLAEIPFAVDPQELSERYHNSDVIYIGAATPTQVNVTVKKLPVLDVRADKESYGLTDTGSLIIRNNTGEGIMVEVTSYESFIKFDARKYHVEDYLEIPFQIRLNAIMTAQLVLRNQPSQRAEIEVRERSGRFKKLVRIVVGEWA